MPTSSPQMTRMFGRWPDGCCCACATLIAALAPSADAAASVVPPSKMLRRLRGALCFVSVSSLHFMTRSLLLGLHQPVADGVADDCGGRREIELAHRRRAMCFDRLDAEIENLAHFLVAVTFRDQLHDHALPRRQRSVELAVLLAQEG